MHAHTHKCLIIFLPVKRTHLKSPPCNHESEVVFQSVSSFKLDRAWQDTLHGKHSVWWKLKSTSHWQCPEEIQAFECRGWMKRWVRQSLLYLLGFIAHTIHCFPWSCLVFASWAHSLIKDPYKMILWEESWQVIANTSTIQELNQKSSIVPKLPIRVLNALLSHLLWILFPVYENIPNSMDRLISHCYEITFQYIYGAGM